jgi:dipeptide/tripeptide permease
VPHSATFIEENALPTKKRVTMKRQIIIITLLFACPATTTKQFTFFVDNQTSRTAKITIKAEQKSLKFTPAHITVPPGKLALIVHATIQHPGMYVLSGTGPNQYISFAITQHDLQELFGHDLFFRITNADFQGVTYPQDIENLLDKSRNKKNIVKTEVE